MTNARETRIINYLMALCAVLGFACFALIILPNQTGGTRGADPGPNKPTITPLSAVIPLDDSRDDRSGKADEHTVRLVLEPQPGEGTGRGDGQGIAPDASGGEGDLAAGDPYGDMQDDISRGHGISMGPPVLKVHPLSSLAKNEPFALDSASGRREKGWLLAPEDIEAEVAFWRDIYTKYGKNQVVLHHPRHLDIIYDIADVSDIANDPRLEDIEREHLIEKRVDERRDEITDILLKLAENPPVNSLTDEEWRIKRLFRGESERGTFKRAADEDGVRAQTGMRDEFVKGLQFSGRFLGEIEEIFESHALPKEITRLIFIESMFDPTAVSSAGAVGIWQFMHRTGKLYLKIDSLVDERYDPIASTHAAAKLLRHNYNELGSWPLAINAYNAGRGRMMQAIRQAGTKDIARIIRGFRHPSYGFASRNFFPGFLAAAEVAGHARRYFGPIAYDDPQRYEIVKANYHIYLPEVLRLSRISEEEFAPLNPGLRNAVLDGRQPLPIGFAIRVPEGRGEIFLAAAARAPKSRRGPLRHVVQSGETLASIAAMYGVSAHSIRESNRGVSRQPRRGQVIVIPW